MQWTFTVFFALTGVFCVILGLILSIGRQRVTAPRQHCASCGWTKEQVQFCEFEQSRQTVVALLCFECTITLEAIPIRPRVRRSSGYKGIPLSIAG